MKCKTNQSFTSLIHNSPDLCKFVAKVGQLDEINQIIASKLDPSLSDNCRVANLRDGTLILATTSPAWNHKLRFSSLDLLSALRLDPRWRGLKSIEIRVDYLPPIDTASNTNPHKPRPLSQFSANLLQQAAASISNPQLAAALRRLGGRTTN